YNKCFIFNDSLIYTKMDCYNGFDIYYNTLNDYMIFFDKRLFVYFISDSRIQTIYYICYSINLLDCSNSNLLKNAYQHITNISIKTYPNCSDTYFNKQTTINDRNIYFTKIVFGGKDDEL